MLDFLPGYEQDIERGAGLAVGAGGDKVVIHTTESARGSFAGIRNLWRGGPSQWNKGLPQFLADGTRVVQLLPLSTNAYTLENKAGGADTNRAGHVIQVEWCRYSNDPWAEDEMAALGKWLADLKLAGLNFDINNYPRFYGSGEGIVLASYNAPQRMSADGWTNFNGWCGHQHAPENAHWDPGFLDAGRVANLANQIVGASNHPQEDDEMVSYIMWCPTGAFQVQGMFKRPLTPENVQALRYLGVQDKGQVPASILDLYTQIPHTIFPGS